MSRGLVVCIVLAAALLALAAVKRRRAVTSRPVRVVAATQRPGAGLLGAVALPSDGTPPPPPPGFPAGVSDPTCHAREHTDYMGESAPVWGLGKPGFHLASPADCCAACQAHNAACGKKGAEAAAWWPARPELRCGRNPGCNLWVFCPADRCFAFDIHVHERGECWLKHQRHNVTRPKDPHEGRTTYPEAMRRAPRKAWPWPVEAKIWPGEMPVHVPWVSGVLAPASERVVSAPADDHWRERWCKKHEAEYGKCDP